MNIASTTPPGIAPRTATATAPPAAPAASPAPASAQASTVSPAQPQTGSPASAPTDGAALTQRINAVVTATKGLDTAWGQSMAQVAAVVGTLGKDAKLPPEASQALGRMMFIGKVLQMKLPTDAKPAPAPTGTAPEAVVMAAEKTFIEALGKLIKESSAVMQSVPSNAPKEVSDVLMAVRDRVTDALYAVKFSRRISPPPAPPAQPAQGTQPAQKVASGTPAPAPASPAKT